MRLYLHGVFAALAALTVAAQTARFETDPMHDRQPKIERGLSSLGLRLTTPTLPDRLTATSPDCAEPITLAELDFDGVGETVARSVIGPPSILRLVYLGSAGGPSSIASIAGRWAGTSILHVVGVHPARVPQTVLVIQLPPACPTLADLDWARLSPWH